MDQGRLNASDRRRWDLIVGLSSVEMQSICMCLHCVEVCTHIGKVPGM